MKQKDWFLCGSVLFALVMVISLQSVQEPLYAGAVSVICAFASTACFAFRLRLDALEKAAAEAKQREEEKNCLDAQEQTRTENIKCIQSMFETLTAEVRAARDASQKHDQTQEESLATLMQKLRTWFETQQQTCSAATDQLQTKMVAATGQIQMLHQTMTEEVQAVAQMSKDVKAFAESERRKQDDRVKVLCDLIVDQHAALRQIVEHQGRDSRSYYQFMVGQPLEKLDTLVETLKAIEGQVDSILWAVEDIPANDEKQLRKALKEWKEEGASLQEKLEDVCKMLKEQGKESRDAMDRVMQSYSNVTAQDIEVLTALTRDIRS